MAVLPGERHSRKEEIWLSCKPKTCCYTAIVVPSGRDIWRIARTTDAPLWSFLKCFPSPSTRPDAFCLGPGKQTYRLALAKGPTSRATKPAPCIFLLRTRGGDHRCGLGNGRPLVCQAFPSDLIDGVLCVRNDGGCTCRAWSLADVDIPREASLVEQRQREAVEYHDVVARWNALAHDGSADLTDSFLAYCAFVLETYDKIAQYQ